MRVRILAAAALLATVAAGPLGPQPTAPEATPFKLGNLQLVALHDAQFAAPNDGKTFGIGAGVPAVAAVLKRAGLPEDRIFVSVNALLVRTGNRVVLIDTGLGPKAGGVLLQSLAKAGIAPGAVTDVLITHSHGDHAGGLLDASGKSVFPKAAIRMSAAEWDWLRSQDKAAQLVAAITPQVATFAPGSEVAPGITAVAIAGHTPGHVGYEIVSGAARLLDIGDTAHSSVVSLAHPEWAIQFDTDRDVSKASRVATLDRLARSHETIFAPHFPYPGIGTVAAAGTGFAWRPGLPR